MWHIEHIMGSVTVWLFDESACHLMHFHFPRSCGISISHLIIYTAVHLHLYTFLLPSTVARWHFYCLHEYLVSLMMPFCLLVCPSERMLVGGGGWGCNGYGLVVQRGTLYLPNLAHINQDIAFIPNSADWRLPSNFCWSLAVGNTVISHSQRHRELVCI